ncbi:glutamate--tRNA ligase, partial [Candidatus Dojkabacteria bacterium]|nr:glutamate--tRNA ligase [Candidatus Dojkabacteria bacterium]
MTTRTRFAPSPTGYFHIAGLQKVLYSYALAKKNNGQYIVRIEDTDRNRYVEGTEDVIFESHKLMGIDIDESIHDGGDYGPYRQSDRLDIYIKYADELIENGFAYYAFETKEELDEMRKSQMDAGHRPRYNGLYREYDLEDARERVEAGEEYVVRLKIPAHREIIVEDLIMGEMKFNTDDLDDYIIVKSDGYPTYHLAVVVDDHLMKISHIFRGVEWIATSPIMKLTYEFFGWNMPEIGHVPNILNPNGQGKLSKRNGSVALSEFFEEGYLKEAIINFIILLGWSPSIERVHGEKEREIFSLKEFIDLFDTKDLNKSNPKFNREKLLWFNKEYIKNFDTNELADRLNEWNNRYFKNNDIEQDSEID